jgi:RNA polymerase sigma-70 factor (ECF subfamily)
MSERSEKQEKEFVNLLVDHQSLIRAFVISLLPGVSEADDVIQMTNEVLWKKRGAFELGTNFKAWVLTTARFQVMSFQQKMKREKRALLDEDVLMMIADEVEEDAEQMNRKLTYLNECIGLLPIRDQELVLHRYWEKGRFRDYAKADGRSEGALKVALYRIRGALRTCIEEKDKTRPAMV